MKSLNDEIKHLGKALFAYIAGAAVAWHVALPALAAINPLLASALAFGFLIHAGLHYAAVEGKKAEAKVVSKIEAAVKAELAKLGYVPKA